LGNIAGWLQKGSQFEATIREEIKCYEEVARVVICEDRKDNTVVKIILEGKFVGKLKGINVCVGDSKNCLYFQRFIGENAKETTITFPKASR
jgi:hypothetical protein